MHPHIRSLLLILGLLAPSFAHASLFEVFAKGSVSKNYITDDAWQVSVSASTGLAVILIPQLRIEGRYSNVSTLQNQLVVAGSSVNFTLTDMKTTSSIYSVGLDLDILSEKYAVQPFLYVGVGYIDTQRSYYLQVSSDPSGQSAYVAEPRKSGLSGNLGAGFRIKITHAVAFEIEAFAYGIELKKPNPLVNWTGTVGIRLFI